MSDYDSECEKSLQAECVVEMLKKAWLVRRGSARHQLLRYDLHCKAPADGSFYVDLLRNRVNPGVRALVQHFIAFSYEICSMDLLEHIPDTSLQN